MKKLLLLLVFSLTVMTAAAQTNDGMFYYAYDHDTQTATLTYRNATDSKGNQTAEAAHLNTSFRLGLRDYYSGN